MRIPGRSDGSSIRTGAVKRNGARDALRRVRPGPGPERGGPRTAPDPSRGIEPPYSAASTTSSFWDGPESRPLASTSRSTNSITAIGALSP